MARCPYCSAWLWTSPSHGVSEVCPKCGATITREEIGAVSKLIVVENPVDSESSLTEDEAEEKWKRDHQDYPEEESPSESSKPFQPQENADVALGARVAGKERGLWGRCRYCHAVVLTRDSSYCSYCGARLIPGMVARGSSSDKGQAPQNKQEKKGSVQEESCMVCNRGLTPDEDIVFCPYCGTVAHRVHLVQWIHEGKPCPRCDAFLDEGSLRR